MTYYDLTLHQRIFLKGIFTSENEQRVLNHRSNKEPLQILGLLCSLGESKKAINMFLKDCIVLK